MTRAPLIPGMLLQGALWLTLSAQGCSGGTDDGTMQMPDAGPSCTAPAGPLHKTVVDQFVMPTKAAPCAIDLDGDGSADNALTGVVAGLKAVSFDLQQSADIVVKSGDLLQLLTLQADDVKTSSCAGLSLRRAKAPAMAPALDGTDKLVPDPAQPGADLRGGITAGALSTARPVMQQEGAVSTLELSLPAGYGVSVPLPLRGVHISGSVRSQGLVHGEVHGAVRNDDVQQRVIPAIAKVVTAFIHDQPDSASAKQIIATFETKAKCDMSPALCCKTTPKTCEITSDEVRGNGLVQSLLKPDVQMYSGDKWAPSARGESPDSFSVGICFTAVSADF